MGVSTFLVTLFQLLLLPVVSAVGVLFLLVTSLLDLLLGTGRKLKPPRSIAITGASTGFGEALALYYAKPGVTLALTGRNEARLKAVVKACTAAGATVKSAKLDVTDKEGMSAFLLKVDAETPIDCVIANAGISEEVVGLERDIVGATYALFSTNVDGVFNTILPLLAPMKERKAGRIIIMSSLASQGAMPGAVAYSATKAAVRTYGEALRGLLYRDGVRVNVVCPGYTESEMTKANSNHMVGLISMERAVRIIVAGIARDTAVITFPTTVHTVFWAFARVLPPALVHALSRRRLSMVPPTNYLRQRSQKKKAA